MNIHGQDDAMGQLQVFSECPESCAFLFTGSTGVGKSLAAKELANMLGCDPNYGDMGGVREIPSGCQDAESTRQELKFMRFVPMFGSGWRVLIVNEADRMTKQAEVIWLDALENLPPRSVVIFTTNEPERLSQRFRNRCDEIAFKTPTPDEMREFVQLKWKELTGEIFCPMADDTGLPKMGGEWTASYRLAVKQIGQEMRRQKISPREKAKRLDFNW